MIKGDRILNVGTPAGGGISIIANDPVASGGGGGDNPPITTALELYMNPDVEAYSDAGTTLAVDGDNVRQWNDQSGNGNTLNQTTASSQPLYNTTVIGNNKASIQSNNDFFLTTNSISIPNTQAEWTFYAVYKRSLLNLEYYICTLTTNSFNRMEWTTQHQIRANGSGRNIAYTDDTNTKIVTYTLDRNAGTIGELKMYVNGTLIGQMSPTSQVNTNWALEFDKLFNSSRGINFGNQLWYNAAHDATQVAQVSDWLNDKYLIY